jgi:hypothetical protein
MIIKAQRDKSAEGFDASKWAGIGEATANENDPIQVQPANVDDEDLEDEQEEQEEQEEIVNKPVNKSSEDQSEENEEEEEYELADEEQSRIENEIKKNNPELKDEELKAKIAESKEQRLKELIDENNNDYEKRLENKIAELAKENSGKSEDEIKALAEKKLKEEDANPFNSFTLDKDQSNESSTTIDYTDLGKKIVIGGQPIDVKENTIEAYQAAVNEAIDKTSESAKRYNELRPDVKDLVDYVTRNGVDALDEWMHPDKKLQEYLNFPSDRLLKEAIIADRKRNNEAIDDNEINEEINDMKKDGTYADNVRDIKTNLRVKLNEVRDAVVQRDLRERQIKEQEATDTINSIYESVTSRLKTMDKFMDTYAIPPKVKDDIAKSITPEAIKRYQSDPEFLVNSIIVSMFGGKLIKGVAQDAMRESKDRSLRLRRNAESPLLKRKISTAGSSTGASSSDENDNDPWTKWKI